MGCIVCATRGGAGSRAVQEQAVAYSYLSGSELIFLYVVDTSALVTSGEKLAQAMSAELNWLGQTVLRIAQARADNAGISSEIVIREGQLREEICQILRERSADLLLLGAPLAKTFAATASDAIEQFADSLLQETGVCVEIVRSGPV